MFRNNSTQQSAPRRRLLMVALAVGILSLMPLSTQSTIFNSQNSGAGATTVAEAMLNDPTILGTATYLSAPWSNANAGAGWSDAPVTTAFGMPNGPDFGLMGSGAVYKAGWPAGNFASTSHGCWSPCWHGGADVTTLRMDLNVPPTHNCLRLNFQFMSEEWPWYVGSWYNDAFIAELDAHTFWHSGFSISAPDNFAFDAIGNPININSATMNSVNGAPTAFSGSGSGGATEPLMVQTPIVPPGGPHTLYLSIMDGTDTIFDTMALVDNIITLYVPNPAQCVPGQGIPPPNLVADFTWSPACPLPGQLVTFTDTSSGATIVDQQWSFGDGTSGIGDPAYKYFGAVGAYPVELTVEDTDGNFASKQQTVNICAPDDTPPILDPIGDQIVNVGDELQLSIAAYDPEGDPFTLAYEDLFANTPPFTNEPDFVDNGDGTATLKWLTTVDDIGVYPAVKFTATQNDNGLQDTELIQINVVVPGNRPTGTGDADGDTIPDYQDNCPTSYNPAQTDTDANGIGDVCDVYGTGAQIIYIDGEPVVFFPDGTIEELSLDTPSNVIDAADLPELELPEQSAPVTITVEDGTPELAISDLDNDGVEDNLDNCLLTWNAVQSDLDGDGQGDACDADADGDLIPQVGADGRLMDNCPFTANPAQTDTNLDGIGDACEGDQDADGIGDAVDNCRVVPNAEQIDSNGDGVGDACQFLTDARNPSFASRALAGATALDEDDGSLDTQAAGNLAAVFPTWAWAAIALGAMVLAGGLYMIARRGRP